MKFIFSNFLIFIALFIGINLHANAQSTSVTLVVTMNNGEEQTLQLTEKSQLYFENGEQLVIEDGIGTNMTFQLSEIQKLICTDYTGIDETASSSLQLTPNPAHDFFIINNLQNDSEARLYTLDGRLMKSFEATEDMMVDISDMAPGMYLLHINGQTFKMMKL